jgi:hypothetical protein
MALFTGLLLSLLALVRIAAGFVAIPTGVVAIGPRVLAFAALFWRPLTLDLRFALGFGITLAIFGNEFVACRLRRRRR